jgi:RNA polymerase sigma-B factor
MTHDSFPTHAGDAWLAESLVAYSRTHEVPLRNEIAERTSWLAETNARRFRHRGEPLTDLVQVAHIGLLKAIERFDPGRSSYFPSFANPTIVGELHRYFRDCTWNVHVPRSIRDRRSVIHSAQAYLEASMKRPPLLSEIADYLGMPASAVIAVMQANLANHLLSLDRVSSHYTTRLESDVDEVLSHEFISQLLHELPHRQQVILYLQFFEEMTQDEIAQQIGISQVHVGRLATRSLDYLHFRLASS